MPDEQQPKPMLGLKAPSIIFSSFEDDDEEIEIEVAGVDGKRTLRVKKGTLRKTHSLNIPQFDLTNEGKRPPI